MHYQLIAFNCRYSHSCLALFYLRNELEHHLPGCQAEIQQFTINDPYYDTLLNISACGAEVLFFSVYIWNAGYILRLIGDLVRVHPERPIVLGGPQAPFLKKLPGQCTVVEGEIEGVESPFYKDLSQGSLLRTYAGASGKSFHSPYRPVDFDGGLKNRQIYYESSRGCPFFCSYCLSSVKHGVYHKDVVEVTQELADILACQPKIIKFVDRTFNTDTKRTLELWNFLAKQAGVTKFHFEIAPDRFTDEMFHFLETVAVDLFQFEIGIQSFHGETLTAVNRQMDVKQAAANIKRLVQLDTVHLHVDLILGLPMDTAVSFQASFNRVFELGPHYIQMGLLKVLPETEVRRQAENFEMIYCEYPPYEILCNAWLDHRTLSNLHAFGECVEAFYNTRFFTSIWKYLRKHKESPFSFFSSLLKICTDHDFFNLAPTQKLMANMLFVLAAERSDREILQELLIYDWLRCGHRFLPEFLASVPLNTIRNELWKRLPQNMEDLYSHQNRDEFFKRGTFCRMSGEGLQEVGLSESGRSGYICFLPEQTTGVIKHCQVVLIE